MTLFQMPFEKDGVFSQRLESALAKVFFNI
jgi:hypothetical protein